MPGKKWLYKAAVILLFFSPVYCKAEDDANAMFYGMIKKFRSLQSFSAKYEGMDYTSSQKFNVEAYSEQPDKTREELHCSSYDHITVFDGNTKWEYRSDLKLVVKSCKQETLVCGLFPYKPISVPVKFYGSEVVNGEDCYILEEDFSQAFETVPDTMKSNDVPKVFKIRYWFSKDKGITMKMQEYDADGTLLLESYILPNTYFTNIPLPEEKFEFNPPDGARIEDYCKEGAS
ncbi:MAG: hypothetical protein Q8R31_04435 [Candidatus Omnitrophota bacterium]|nr:hypothetical protein [Candidatus Omnitrophota bacterium]